MGESNRRKLVELVELLTPDQLHIFRLCFDTTLADDVKQEDLKNAVRLCEVTVKDNQGRILDVIVERMADD